MKTILFLGLFALASARPQRSFESGEFIPIVAETRSEPEDGSYAFSFESANGILRSEAGRPGVNGGTDQEGSWSLTYPDGSTGEFSFVAGEQGAHFESPRLPVGPEIPEFVLEQIRFAEEERQQGIFHDGRWDASKYGAGNY